MNSTMKVDWSRRRVASRLGMIAIATTLALGLFGLTNVYAGPNDVTWPTLHTTLVADDFDSPIDVVSANDGTGRLFVLEQGGKIFIVQDGERLEPYFLDISSRVSHCRECGLLGLAFPPDFAEKGYFFINYTSNQNLAPAETGDPDLSNDTVIARYHVTDNPNRADSVAEEAILIINQPDLNHNGGHLVFGPDNYLYIGMGDGGGGGDVFENAQNPASLLGKILRISVSDQLTYTIPASNPFTTTAGYRDEIWAMGVRNPWRFGFDHLTGDLYIADVGQDSFEEVNYIAAADLGNGGQNYGWPIYEGNQCNHTDECDHPGLTPPVATYVNGNGECSITGGVMYDSQVPAQARIYLYADFCSGRLWGLQPDGVGWETRELGKFSFEVSSFGEDELGNAYVVNHGGAVYHFRIPSPVQHLPALVKPE